MKKPAIFILAILVSINISAQTLIPGGNISGKWVKTGSPYRIQGDITINNGDSLEIEAGVVVDFEGHYRFLVNGVLIAQGTIGDSIRFTRVSNDGYMTPDTVGLADTSNLEGSWHGIEWSTSPGIASSLSHCIFEFINSVDNTGDAWAVNRAPFHYGYAGGLKLANSVIRNNYGARGGGIYATDHVILDSCLITHNNAVKLSDGEFATAGGILLWYAYNSVVSNCVISNNSANDPYSAGGMRIQAGNPLIINNIIKNNISYYNYYCVGGIYCAGAYPSIIQNLVINNESLWIGGIYYDAGGGQLYNNTICNNKGHRDEPGGIKFVGSSGTIVMNNIIYGNEDNSGLYQILLNSISTQPVVKYNLIGNGMEEILGNDYGAIKESDNYFGNPLFIHPSSIVGVGDTTGIGDWYLSKGSFLINQGNNVPVEEFGVEKDIAGNRRINYGHVDPGCLEFRIQSYTPDSLINTPEIWIADTVHITRETELNAKVTIYPGVVIMSHGHFEIKTLDTLYAMGTADAPILWTIQDTTGFSETTNEEGGWGSIRIFGTQPRIFRHCIFEFGKVKRPPSVNIGLIWGTYNGNVEIEDCIFRNCLGISASLVYFTSGANYSIESSTFYNNGMTTTGGKLIEVRWISNMVVRGNFIYNNWTGDLIQLGGAKIDFINNSIYNNNGRVVLSECFNLNVVNNTIIKNTGIPALAVGDNARIINTILPNLRISSQEGYEIVSSYVPEDLCTEGRCIDLLTEEPVFKNPLPYSGIGPLEEILQADYSLADISPGIDFGTPDTAGLKLADTDIAGNPRFNNGRIDIGAWENQGKLPVITAQPTGGTFCIGDDHTLKVEYAGADTVLFQWFRNGAVIPGQDGYSFELHSLLETDEGNYHCELSNAYGKVISSTVYIKVNAKPGILVQPRNQWHEAGKPLSLSVAYSGSSPIHFHWEKDGVEIPGEESPEYNFNPTDSSYEGMYTCRISNTCGTVNTDPAALYLAPQLCMVTVDQETGNNLVIWEKKSKAPVLAYNIYRESSAAGIYDLLETAPFDDLSIYVDTTADPTVRAYLYKITAIDTAGNETDADLCKPHKTIHLLVSTNPEFNTTQLAWDRYYGFDYSTYLVLRSVEGSPFSEVDYLSSNLNSWTDREILQGDIAYRIAVERFPPCYPEGGGKKAGTGPYTHALSNLDDNKLKEGQMPPDSILLSNHSIEEESLPGTLIGKLFTEDQDSIDSHTYQFVPGDGDEDNPSFTLLGDLLLASESFDYEIKNQYTIRIRSTDLAGNYCEVPLIIRIIDVDETTGLPVLNAESINVFPNPFSHSTTIRFQNPSGRAYRLVLTDLSGKVYRVVENIVTEEYVLEKGDLPPGFYFIELKGQRTCRGKIIID